MTRIPMISRTASRDIGRRGRLKWADLRRIRERWQGALVIKGILHAEDARMAREHGADGIIVSNHGGRQLDAAVSPLLLIPEIKAVSGAMTLMVDSGFRRGTDVLKALALGADFVFLGAAICLCRRCQGRSRGPARDRVVATGNRCRPGHAGARIRRYVGTELPASNRRPGVTQLADLTVFSISASVRCASRSSASTTAHPSRCIGLRTLRSVQPRSNVCAPRATRDFATARTRGAGIVSLLDGVDRIHQRLLLVFFRHDQRAVAAPRKPSGTVSSREWWWSRAGRPRRWRRGRFPTPAATTSGMRMSGMPTSFSNDSTKP